MLIDTFVNSVILYDDKIDFYFNYTENVKSLSVSELNIVSDFASPSPPRGCLKWKFADSLFLFENK